MVFIVLGTVLLLMKWFEFGPVAHWSWWIVLLPFAGGLIWFEIVEPMLGLDKKKAHSDLEKVKQDRIKKSLERVQPPRR
ncbi:MAG: TIGR04438 family Trp-rich protein [Burkholderiaceae bacterium]